MSKYNLIDIFEQYKIGSGWTNDFDYDGMLNAGLKVSVDTNIETLKKLAEDFTDVNYHREASHLYDAIEAIEGGDAFEAGGKLNDFFAEIRQTQEDQGMDTSDDLGAYMASKMDLDEDKYDDIVDADDDIPADKKKAAALAYRKVDKGASYEKATSHIKEVRIDDEVADRIEGLTNRELKRKFLFAFEDLYSDLIEEDPFHAEDVIAHLSNEMNKHLSSFQNTGDKFAGIEEKDAVNFDMKADADYDEGLEDIEEALPKFKGVPPMRDIVKALKNDAKATDSEIKQFMASVKKAGDEFDDVDDYVEDFKNYVADKSLQEKQYAVDEASDTFNIDKVASPDAKAHDYGAEIKGISDEDDTEEKYAHQTVTPLEEIDPTLDPYEDRDEIIKQVMSLLIKEKGASKEELKGFIETHIEDILNARDDDDVVDEFAQYISVNEGYRSLREHFNRFK